MVGYQDGRRKVLWVGVDRVAEEHDLDDWYAQHHAEGDAVALELQEFLQHDAPPARHREHHGFGPKLSTDCSVRWMNTSSSPVAAGCTRLPVPAIASRNAASSAAASRPVTCSVDPKAATCSMPGRPRRRSA